MFLVIEMYHCTYITNIIREIILVLAKIDYRNVAELKGRECVFFTLLTCLIIVYILQIQNK